MKDSKILSNLIQGYLLDLLEHSTGIIMIFGTKWVRIKSPENELTCPYKMTKVALQVKTDKSHFFLKELLLNKCFGENLVSTCRGAINGSPILYDT